MPRYTILLDPDPDEGGFTVTVPLLPGCITEGDMLDEALANAREAIRLHLRGLALDGEPIPEETPPLLMTTVDVEAAEGAASVRG